MKALTALNRYFNDGSYGVPKKPLKDFKQEVAELSPEDKEELGALACTELNQPFEAAA